MFTRREWLAANGSLAIGAALQSSARADEDEPFEFCAFIKFLQDLTYPDLARKIREMGFDGIEATVRDGGHVLPERVEEDLPRLVGALEKEDS